LNPLLKTKEEKKLETHLIVEKHTVRRAEEESIKKQE
jgi:hypothetical protein